ncbi:MAG: hypothetical protein ACRDS0_36295 [Pseudonocardiaceae bacterium]
MNRNTRRGPTFGRAGRADASPVRAAATHGSAQRGSPVLRADDDGDDDKKVEKVWGEPDVVPGETDAFGTPLTPADKADS